MFSGAAKAGVTIYADRRAHHADTEWQDGTRERERRWHGGAGVRRRDGRSIAEDDNDQI